MADYLVNAIALLLSLAPAVLLVAMDRGAK